MKREEILNHIRAAGPATKPKLSSEASHTKSLQSNRYRKPVPKAGEFSSMAPIRKHTGSLSAELDEMTPTGATQIGKIQKVNTDGTADITDAKGTVTKVDQKNIVPDATDPNKLTVNIPKPKIQAGTNVTIAEDDAMLDAMLRIARVK